MNDSLDTCSTPPRKTFRNRFVCDSVFSRISPLNRTAREVDTSPDWIVTPLGVVTVWNSSVPSTQNSKKCSSSPVSGSRCSSMVQSSRSVVLVRSTRAAPAAGATKIIVSMDAARVPRDNRLLMGPSVVVALAWCPASTPHHRGPVQSAWQDSPREPTGSPRALLHRRACHPLPRAAATIARSPGRVHRGTDDQPGFPVVRRDVDDGLIQHAADLIGNVDREGGSDGQDIVARLGRGGERQPDAGSAAHETGSRMFIEPALGASAEKVGGCLGGDPEHRHLLVLRDRLEFLARPRCQRRLWDAEAGCTVAAILECLGLFVLRDRTTATGVPRAGRSSGGRPRVLSLGRGW